MFFRSMSGAGTFFSGVPTERAFKNGKAVLNAGRKRSMMRLVVFPVLRDSNTQRGSIRLRDCLPATILTCFPPEVNEEKRPQGGTYGKVSFGFLDLSSVVSGVAGDDGCRCYYPGEERTALLGKRQEIFRASGSQPVGGVIEKIKSDPAGWVKY